MNVLRKIFLREWSLELKLKISLLEAFERIDRFPFADAKKTRYIENSGYGFMISRKDNKIQLATVEGRMSGSVLHFTLTDEPLGIRLKGKLTTGWSFLFMSWLPIIVFLITGLYYLLIRHREQSAVFCFAFCTLFLTVWFFTGWLEYKRMKGWLIMQIFGP